MDKKFINEVALLEARLAIIEQYVNAITRLNPDLELPKHSDVLKEINRQKEISKKKYSKFSQ